MEICFSETSLSEIIFLESGFVKTTSTEVFLPEKRSDGVRFDQEKNDRSEGTDVSLM